MLRHSSCFLHTLDFAVFLFLSAGAYATTSRFCASAAKHSLLRTSAVQAGMANESQWSQIVGDGHPKDDILSSCIPCYRYCFLDGKLKTFPFFQKLRRTILLWGKWTWFLPFSSSLLFWRSFKEDSSKIRGGRIRSSSKKLPEKLYLGQDNSRPLPGHFPATLPHNLL